MLYLILLLFLLVCIGLTAITVLDVSTQVHITILTWQSPDAPIGFWMLGAFFLGALLLYLVSVASAIHDRREIRRLRHQVSDLRQSAAAAVSGESNAAASASQQHIDVVPMQVPVQSNGSNGFVQGQQNGNSIGTAQLENKSRYIPMPGIQPMRENLPPQNSGQ